VLLARNLFPLVALGLWLWLWKFVGEHTWTWGRVTFWILLAIATLLSLLHALPQHLRAGAGWVRTFLIVILGLTSVYLIARQAQVIRSGFDPPWAQRLWDVSQGAYDFNRALFTGENPYRTKAQYHPVEGTRGYTRDAEGREYLFGWRYYYGYPHFPMSALWFAPFMGMTGNYNDIRIGNLVYFVLSLLLLNAIVASASAQPLLASLTATVAFLGIDFLVTETFQLGIVDQAFAFPLLVAILLAMRSYWRIAGLVAGLALASKHFPSIPVVLALAIYAHRRQRLRDLIGFSGLSFLAVMLPFILWDAEALVSATILHHVHEAGRGDDTALFFFLPDVWKMPFRLLGLASIGGVYVWGIVASKRSDVRVMFLVMTVVSLLINAFYPVTHLNHLESILAFAAGSFALGVHGGRSSPAFRHSH
jgi:hypothetical protein